MSVKLTVAVLLGMGFLDAGAVAQANGAPVEAIDFVWFAHGGGFDAVVRGEHQVVAYCDASRQMSVALSAWKRAMALPQARQPSLPTTLTLRRV